MAEHIEFIVQYVIITEVGNFDIRGSIHSFEHVELGGVAATAVSFNLGQGCRAAEGEAIEGSRLGKGCQSRAIDICARPSSEISNITEGAAAQALGLDGKSGGNADAADGREGIGYAVIMALPAFFFSFRG